MEEDDGNGVECEEYDDEDIYGDLESDIFGPSAKKSRVDEVVQHEKYQNLEKENLCLKRRIKQLEKENRTYSNNISSLYLTAKGEIDKKNFIIKNITEKLKQVTKSKSELCHREVEEILTKCQEALQESQSQVTLNEIKNGLKSAPEGTVGKRKTIKFGNMSLYFFREQGSFQRENDVDFPAQGKPATSESSEKSHDKCQTSHPESSEQTQNVDRGRSKEMFNNNNEAVSATDRPSQVVLNRANHDVHSPNDVKNSFLKEAHEPEYPNRRKSTDASKDANRLEYDRNRDRDRNNHRRNNSDERYGPRHVRSRDYSPSTDRHHVSRKGEDDRYNTRGSKDYDSRRAENSNRHSLRNHDSRPLPPKRFTKDIKYSSSSSTFKKSTRSRSNSK